MATKGPKSDITTKSVVKPEPVAVKAPKPVAAQPVKPATAKVTKPVAVKAPVVQAPVVKAPVAQAPVVKAPVAAPVIAAAPVVPAIVAKPAPVAPPVAAPTPAPVAEPVAAPMVAAAPTPTPVPTPVITPVAVAAPAVPVLTNASKKANIMENTVHAATEKTQAMFIDMNERTKAAMEKSTQMFADMNELSKGHVEALVESSKIAAKGIETMSQEAADYTRKTFEGATAAMRNMASVKTPADFMKLQSEFVRTSFDNLVAETSKNTEAMLKLAGDVAQPLSNRVAVAAEKIKVVA